MNEEERLERIKDELHAIVKQYFPEHFISNWGYANPNFHVNIAEANKYLANTPYFYNEELTFIHWTSVNNLMSMLNYREIRLYNLFNSKDEHEFGFAANAIGLTKEEIEHAKQFYFIFSFCKREDLQNRYLWETYGDNYKGVAVQFSIQNNPRDWRNFMISPVYYELPYQFEKFRNAIEDLERKEGVVANVNLGKILGFHKKEAFQKENEVRLAAFHPYQNIKEYWKYTKTEFRLDSERNRISKYISLPLWVDNNSATIKNNKPELDRRLILKDDFFDIAPKVKLENVYFGINCGIKGVEFQKFRQEIEKIISLNLGYRISLTLNLFDHKLPTYQPMIFY